ncbi:NAD(P)-binding protein [Coniochaeta ligniaria NRRL 30616]|uniref:NAD(P)-binding protein n=1 Tax=Coniochaeta ligniaria NRRL 30616 TaxID=1408157 RepID=A0A1J7JKM7_9PEZI|nr:NAD(P)-binding protein [Coniochaeta ligniaria NRRL 30616]
MENLPPDFWVTSLQFTPKTYQTNYPAIDPTNPQNSLAGKVVIINGASRGIGAMGITPAVTKAGPKGVVLVASGPEKLSAVEKEVHKISPHVKTLAVPTDIRNPESVADLFRKVKETFGHADILINNAGVFKGKPVIHENDVEEWWDNFEVNTKGAFLVMKQFISLLPSPDYPAVIANLVTSVTYKTLPFMSGYILSKLASQQLTANIAAGYPNITAINVHPGLYDTDILNEAFRRFNLDDPSLIGGTLVWLGADPERSKFLSGRTIVANWDVDGLVARKEEIVSKDLLVLDWKGTFGKEQFEKQE